MNKSLNIKAPKELDHIIDDGFVKNAIMNQLTMQGLHYYPQSIEICEERKPYICNVCPYVYDEFGEKS